MQEQQIKWLHKVRELFFQVGVKSVTMDHIAAALGISKKTLYQWVPNKSALVEMLITSFIDQAKCDNISACSNAIHALDELALSNEDSIKDLSMMKTNVVFDIRNYYPEAWDKMKAYQRSFILTVITKNLERGIMEGFYRTDLNIELVARLHGHQIFNLFDEDWFPTQQYARVQVFREFMKSYAYSIVNEKGRQYLEANWKD